MKIDTHQQPALESYATFWEPIATESAFTSTPTTTGTSANSAEAKDAYLEFVNVTEGVPSTQPAPKP